MTVSQTRPLPPPDLHHWTSVHGWLELGDPAEAAAELAKISATWRDHPVVLDAEWLVYIHQERWDDAFQIAEQSVRLHPAEASGWIHRAYAARRRTGGGLQEARDLLLEAVVQFPREAIIPYNLACYSAQLGELDDALRWIEQAFEVGKRDRLLPMALIDADLEPLWPQLRRMT